VWSSGQSSRLHIQRCGFDSRCYQIFWEVVGLERGSLSLVNTIEELLENKSSGSGKEIRDYGRRESVTLTTWHHLPQKLALTSPTSGGSSVVGMCRFTNPFFFFFTEIHLLAIQGSWCPVQNTNQGLPEALPRQSTYSVQFVARYIATEQHLLCYRKQGTCRGGWPTHLPCSLIRKKKRK
jgi:hypothetical protein